jgi:hypothetical protein
MANEIALRTGAWKGANSYVNFYHRRWLVMVVVRFGMTMIYEGGSRWLVE